MNATEAVKTKLDVRNFARKPVPVDVKMSVTSPACPSGATIAEDIRTKLSDAGFPNPKVQIVMEPAWSPQRISEAGRKTLGI